MNVLATGRYLVTGGAGFLGSHLCEFLIQRGCEVISFDNLITGNAENLVPLLRDRKFIQVDKDISEPVSLDGGLAGIFHLASPASPVDYLKYPIETLKTGALGTDNVLRLALEKQCPVLVASTSEVYGNPLEHPQPESYWGNVNPIGPRGCYDESKRYLEAVTMAYHRVHQLRTRIIRIFNTYGPKMRTNDGRVVSNFCVQALLGKPLTVYGEGTQTRSFCYVDDMIEAIVRAFCSDSPLPINVGNPEEYTIMDFAKKILELSGSKSSIVKHPLPEDDPKVRCPDIRRAKELLQWGPKIGIEEGLRRTLAYFADREL